jgi:replicative DNA helicase
MSQVPDDGRRPGAVALENGRAKSDADLLTQRREAEDAEISVLGALLQLGSNWEQIDAIMNLLPAGADTFGRRKHSRVYTLLQQLRENDVPLDAIAVTGRMTQEDFRLTDKALFLTECIAATPIPASAGFYAREVTNAWALRQAQNDAVRSLQLLAASPLSEAPDTVRDVQRRAALLETGPATESLVMWDEATSLVTEAAELAEVEIADDSAGGLGSGWAELDELTGGDREGHITVVAARPGVGKSVAGLNIAQHRAMRQGLPFIWFTMEMSALECAQRMMCAGAEVYWDRMRDGRMDDRDWIKIAGYIRDTKGAPMAFDDTVGMTTAHIERAVTEFARKYVPEGTRFGGIGIDYLGFLKETPAQRGMPRHLLVDSWMLFFKELARRFKTHVYVLSQLNRGPENRQNKRPTLGDLRESGGIEQTASNVLFIHRDDYYDKEAPNAGLATFDLAKCRSGRAGEFELAAQLHMARFASMAE